MTINNACNESFHTFDLLTKFLFQIANRIHDFLIVHYRIWRWKHFEIVFLILNLFSNQILRSLYTLIFVFSSLSFLIISSSSKNIFKMSFTFERHRKRRFVLFLIMLETFEKFEYELLVFRIRVLKKYFQHVSKTSHF